MLTDKTPVRVFQYHREPEQTWTWFDEFPDDFSFIVKKPDNTTHDPVLIISLSGRITHDRIESVTGNENSIWELTIDDPNNNYLQSEKQLSMFREAVRKLMVDINATHGNSQPLSIFPAMSVACSVELGRVRMPKSDMPWILFDYNNKHKCFVKTLTIGA
jgi:hypothetical protein